MRQWCKVIKRCCKCKEDLDIKQFKSNKTRKDGLQSQCIACQKEYRKKNYDNNKAYHKKRVSNYKKDFIKWWKEYKKQFTCQNCGENDPACIDFHHISDKDECVSRLVASASKNRLLAEIQKCIPLCANCHRKVHYKY